MKLGRISADVEGIEKSKIQENKNKSRKNGGKSNCMAGAVPAQYTMCIMIVNDVYRFACATRVYALWRNKDDENEEKNTQIRTAMWISSFFLSVSVCVCVEKSCANRLNVVHVAAFIWICNVVSKLMTHLCSRSGHIGEQRDQNFRFCVQLETQ